MEDFSNLHPIMDYGDILSMIGVSVVLDLYRFLLVVLAR